VSVCIYIYMSPSKTRKTESGQGLKFSSVFLGLGNLKNIKINNKNKINLGIKITQKIIWGENKK